MAARDDAGAGLSYTLKRNSTAFRYITTSGDTRSKRCGRWRCWHRQSSDLVVGMLRIVDLAGMGDAVSVLK